jgi:hypothetical protein
MAAHAAAAAMMIASTGRSTVESTWTRYHARSANRYAGPGWVADETFLPTTGKNKTGGGTQLSAINVQ